MLSRELICGILRNISPGLRLLPILRTALAVAVILAVTCPAHAQGPFFADPTVITVSEKPLPVSAASATVTVLTREEIEKSRARNAGELLTALPGLHVSRTGGFGGRTTISIRGGDPNFTLVLIDGVAVNDITDILGGSFDFSGLSTVNIDRIEIVRGPLSSIYGSEAMSGVVNIITRQGGEGLSTDVSVMGGRFLTRELQASFRSKWRQLAFSAGASHAGAEEQVEGDEFRAENLNFKVSLDLRGGKQLQGTATFLRSNTTGFPDNGGGPLYSLTRDVQNRKARQFTTALEYTQPIRSSWRIRAHVAQFDGRQQLNVPTIVDDTPPGPFSRPSIEGDSDLSRVDAHAASEWQVFRDFTAIVGGGIRRESGRGSNLLAESFPTSFSLTRTTPFLTGELQYSRGAFGASFAIRSDFPSGAGQQHHSPDFGLTYVSPSGHVRARIGLRHAFKLPSFFALADPSVGNPALLPEKNRAIDGGIGVFFGEGKPTVSLSLFRNRFRDLIDFSPQAFVLVNRTDAHADGAEVEVTLPLHDAVKIRGQATFVSSGIEGTDEPLRDRPRWRTGFGVTWEPRTGLELRHETRWVSSRADFQIPVPQFGTAPAYWTTDLITEYTVRTVSLFLRFDNIGNSRYEEFVGFPNPGFAVAAGMSTRFGR